MKRRAVNYALEEHIVSNVDADRQVKVQANDTDDCRIYVVDATNKKLYIENTGDDLEVEVHDTLIATDGTATITLNAAATTETIVLSDGTSTTITVDNENSQIVETDGTSTTTLSWII